MSNKLKKIQKNVYKTMPYMTQEQCDKKIKELDVLYQKQYQKKLNEKTAEMNEHIKNIVTIKENALYEIIKIMHAEYALVLANAMNIDKQEDEEIIQQIQDRIFDIYKGVQNSIDKYNKYKKPKKELVKKLNKVKRELNLDLN